MKLPSLVNIILPALSSIPKNLFSIHNLNHNTCSILHQHSKMKTAVAFSALFASTFAQNYFGVISARSASPVHLLSLTANGGKFYLGGETSSYCPPQVGETCNDLPGNYTVFAGGSGTLSLAVVVPGGQQGM
jgi:hypothetical protein